MSPEIDLTGEQPQPGEGTGGEQPNVDKPKEDGEETRRRGRPSNRSRGRALEEKLQGGFNELAEIIERRDPELGAILREDGPRMAGLVARTAVKIGGPVLVLVVFVASALEPLRAFGRTGRLFVDRVRDRREQAAADRAAAAEQGDGEDGQPPAGPAADAPQV